MATEAAGDDDAESSVADQLRALGLKGVLMQMAERPLPDPQVRRWAARPRERSTVLFRRTYVAPHTASSQPC